MTVREIYEGSDASATKTLYKELSYRGPLGCVVMNLLRTQKASKRAKLYRGGLPGEGSFRAMAYAKKQWSMEQLCDILLNHAAALMIVWGWREDVGQEFHNWVLYVDLPGFGQVSFHTARRGKGPQYDKEWDRQRLSEERILSFADSVYLNRMTVTADYARHEQEYSATTLMERLPDGSTAVLAVKTERLEFGNPGHIAMLRKSRRRR